MIKKEMRLNQTILELVSLERSQQLKQREVKDQLSRIRAAEDRLSGIRVAKNQHSTKKAVRA